MKKLRIVTLGCIASFAAGAVLVAACSDSDTVITTPATDSGVPDTSVTPPTPTPGPSDAGDGAAPTVPDFVAEIESSFCSALTRCCFGNADLTDGGAIDGGHYSGDQCHQLVHNIGFEFSSVGAELLDGGTVTIDPTKAQDCANQLSALACNLTGTSLQTVRTACFDAFVGHVAAGDNCVAAIECGVGNFCSPASHKCTPLAGDGGACQAFDVSDASTAYEQDIANSAKDEDLCSTRGGGDTHMHCDSYDPSTGFYKDAGPWKCAPNVANNEGCNSSVWCADGICDITNGDFICRSPVDYFAGANNACAAVTF